MDSPEQKITKTVSRVDASKESMANSRQVIGINFCGPTPLMWRADDLKSVRELGIIGTLVGSLARQPRQNTRLGRPLELLPEEGRLMADMGRAAVIPDSTVNTLYHLFSTFKCSGDAITIWLQILWHYDLYCINKAIGGCDCKRPI